MGQPAATESEDGQSFSETYCRELFRKIREGFFVADLVRDEHGRGCDFVFLEINDAFTLQTGLTPEATLGHRVSEAIPGFPDSLISRYGELIDSGTSAAFEVDIPALEHRSYEARTHPLGDDRFAVLFLEITDRKRIEKALQESRTLLSDIVESVDQMVWSSRPDGYHDFFNRRWYDFTGVEFGSTDGEAWMRLFHPDDHDRAIARWRHSLATGELYEIEYRLRHRSGEYRWVLGRAHPVRNEAGQIIRWMGTCTDIQAQKTFAEKLELASRELSHRIKNIFAVVSSLITFSAREHPEAHDFADEVRDRIAALSRAHDYARPHGKDSLSDDAPASVLGLVRELLAPYAIEGHDRMVAEGDDALLKERAVTPIALAVHELATNAAK